MQMCGSDRMNQLPLEIIKEMNFEYMYIDKKNVAHIFVINLWLWLRWLNIWLVSPDDCYTFDISTHKMCRNFIIIII